MKRLFALVATATLFAGLAATEADARAGRGGGGGGGARMGGGVSRAVAFARPAMPSAGRVSTFKPVGHRPHGHGHGHRGGLWVWGGVTILGSSYAGCGYEYYMWLSTGSPHWRARYNDCRGW